MSDAENEQKKVVVKKVVKKVVPAGESASIAAKPAVAAAPRPAATAPKGGYAAGPVIDFSKANVAWTQADIDMIKNLKDATSRIMGEIRKGVVGQEKTVRLTIISLLSQGHSLLMGVPGLGKTLLVSSIAQGLSLKFKRVQFTPDLMPSDITGTEVIQEDKTTGERHFRFLEGPIFTNLLLADEINRTPPKTQASLLEAMQEKQVTVGGVRRKLEPPFFVLATQNPVEQEGTYPLPEAQLDRFMFQLNVGYPTLEEERTILAMTTTGYRSDIKPVLTKEEIMEYQRLVRMVHINEPEQDLILQLVRNTRSREEGVPDFIKTYVSWGAGPRACQYLVIGAKAVAILEGRNVVQTSDIIEVTHSVLCHRIAPNFAAESEGISSEVIVDKLIEHVLGK